MLRFLTLDDLDVSGKTVLVRTDLNVPMQDGVVTENNRIDRTLPTIQELSRRGARVVLLSHFGRPRHGRDTENSLRQVLPALEAALKRRVVFADDCVGPAAVEAIKGLSPGGIALLENIRFHEGEEANDPTFARQLAALGDLYVDDAFSAAHRAHASIAGLAYLLPAAAGRLMQDEISALDTALDHPRRPVGAVVGGAKISTKLALLGNIVEKVELLILGGGMANTFLAARGVNVGKSLCEHHMFAQVDAIEKRAIAAGCEIMLPVDAVVTRAFKAHAASQTLPVADIPADGMILDCGPQTVELVSLKLQGCQTILWNGPLGAFELAPFDAGTKAVAGLVAALTKAGRVRSVAGGGDTVAALNQAGAADSFTYVSTAGGAFLEWLEGKDLPGVTALRHAAKNTKDQTKMAEAGE